MKKLWNWIKCLFKKKEEYPGYGEGPNPFYKYGFIIPHTRKSQGATSHNGIYSEYNYALSMLKDPRLLHYHRFTRDDGGVAGAAKRLKEKGVNFSIEPHFNAYNGGAHGYEILVLKGDKKSEDQARLMLDYFASIYPGRRARHDNGIKLIEKGDRGYYNLVAAKKYMDVAILSELFFGDNAIDFIKPEEQGRFWANTLQK